MVDGLYASIRRTYSLRCAIFGHSLPCDTLRVSRSEEVSSAPILNAMTRTLDTTVGKSSLPPLTRVHSSAGIVNARWKTSVRGDYTRIRGLPRLKRPLLIWRCFCCSHLAGDFGERQTL